MEMEQNKPYFLRVCILGQLPDLRVFIIMQAFPPL